MQPQQAMYKRADGNSASALPQAFGTNQMKKICFGCRQVNVCKRAKKICPSFNPGRIILKKTGEIQPPVLVWVGELLEKKPMKIDLEIIMPLALDVVKSQKYK